MKVIHFIRINAWIWRAGLLSAVVFMLLSAAIVCPVGFDVPGSKATAGIAHGSTITLSVERAAASVNLAVADAGGSFATSSSSEQAAFSVTTDHYTGYTLSISAPDDSGTLINGTEMLSSIPSSVDKVLTDATFNNAVYNNSWAYKPSKYYNGSTVVDNTGVNAVYLASPTTAATVLDVTSSANNEANAYTIGLGARADYTKAFGAYSETFNLIAVGNPIAYTIDFDENTTDTVQNMPTTQVASTSTTFATLPSTVPTREHYDFLGWCNMVTTTTGGVDSCTGTGATIYNPNGDGTNLDYGIDQTTTNVATLYAMWRVKSYTCSKRYRLQNVDGTYPATYTADIGESVKYGETCSYAKTIADYQGDNGNDTERTTSGTMTGDTTLSLDFPRNTYALTIEKNNTYVSTVTGAGSYRWGQEVQIGATILTTGEFLNWMQTAGDTITFAKATDESTTFTMPKTAVTVYAEALMMRIQNLDPSLCTTSGMMVRDSRDNNEYLIKRLADNKCWMIDSLDMAGGTQLTWQDTNMDANWTLPTGNGFLADNRIPLSNISGFDTSTWAYVYNTGTTECNNTNHCRSYYSWTTATLASGLNIRAEDTDAPFSICPKGWKLPTSRTTVAGNSDYYKLAVAYGMASNVVSQNTSVVYNRAGYGTAANFTLSGYGGYSWFGYNGEFAALWSSTGMANAENARYFLLGPSIVKTQEVGYRSYGSQIRCILIQ